MSRTQNIKKNVIFLAIKYCTQIVLQFVLRTILIYMLGAEYLGLNGLFTNIFAFLNLAELGIGTAIVYSMYKPIAENDVEKVKSLQKLYKKFYTFIALIVLVVGLSLTPFLKYLIKDNVTVDINIYILYLMYLLNALAGYYSAHKRSLLFAHQRNDVENKIKTGCILSMTIIQIVVLCITKNYYIYFAVNIVFTWLEAVLVKRWANKLYPHINGDAIDIDQVTKKEITKNVAALSLNKIGRAIVGSTDNILISIFLGITILGAYSNYYMITFTLSSIIGVLITGVTGSVGDLIATADKEYVLQRYNILKFMFAYYASFATICLICLFQPFIVKWTGGGIYSLDITTVVLISIAFYLSVNRSINQIFNECAGLFWQNRWTPVVEAVVNLVVSIALVFPLGINGIFIGTIVSTVVMPMWVEPLVLYKYYFKKSVGEYFKRYFIDALIMVCGCIICYGVCSFIPDGGWLLLIAKFAVCIVLSNVILILAYLPTAEFKSCWAIVKKLWGNIKAKFNKKKVVDSVENNDIEK